MSIKGKKVKRKSRQSEQQLVRKSELRGKSFRLTSLTDNGQSLNDIENGNASKGKDVSVTFDSDEDAGDEGQGAIAGRSPAL